MLKFLFLFLGLGVLPAVTVTQLPWFNEGPGPDFGGQYHSAPAPLLAAGIPAFAALGGAAGLGRWIRRRRPGAPSGATTEADTSGA